MSLSNAESSLTPGVLIYNFVKSFSDFNINYVVIKLFFLTLYIIKFSFFTLLLHFGQVYIVNVRSNEN